MKKTGYLTLENHVNKETECGRAVLLINNDIKTVKKLEQALCSQKYVKNDLKIIYSREDKENENIHKEMKPGNVIFATNLAGRGTDIKCDNIVNNNGGIHVIVTFLPSSQRVQQQAFGRTGRNGNKGTYQIIWNREDLEKQFTAYKNTLNFWLEDSKINFKNEDIFQIRDAIESWNLDRNLQNYENSTRPKDDLFEEFTRLKNSLGTNDNHKEALTEIFGLFHSEIDTQKNKSKKFLLSIIK